MPPIEPRGLPGPSGPLCGTFFVPSSKSLTNRALLAAAVAQGGCVLNPLDCEDTRLLADALSEAGWQLRWDESGVHIGRREVQDLQQIRVDLGNSGTGARLMVALLASVEGRFVVDGSARLRQRPVGPLVDALQSLGARISSRDGCFPLTIDGRCLAGGPVKIRPLVSSQFVTALLLVAPLMTRGLELSVEDALPSAPYLGLTADVLRGFGAQVEHSADFMSWKVAGKPLRRTDWRVEGDWSAAAFPLAAAALAGGSIEVAALSVQSRQGDRVVLDFFEDAGVRFEVRRDRLQVIGPAGSPLKADLADCPDAFPALAAVAACRLPGSRFTGLGNLIHKESDRLTAMADNLRRLGARLRVDDEMFTVDRTVDCLSGAVRPVTAAADHRVAMAMAVTALHAGPLLLDDSACVGKSFPGFWESWRGLVENAAREDG